MPLEVAGGDEGQCPDGERFAVECSTARPGLGGEAVEEEDGGLAHGEQLGSEIAHGSLLEVCLGDVAVGVPSPELGVAGAGEDEGAVLIGALGIGVTLPCSRSICWVIAKGAFSSSITAAMPICASGDRSVEDRASQELHL